MSSLHILSNCLNLGLLSATWCKATSTTARCTGDATATDADERHEQPKANEADEGGQEGGGGAVCGRGGVFFLPGRVGP